jgi:hypothetical protein
MGIFYDPAARKWAVSKEKTNYDTNRPTSTTVYKITRTDPTVLNPVIVTYSTEPPQPGPNGSQTKVETIVIDNNTKLNDLKYSQQLQDIYKANQDSWKINAEENKKNESLNSQNTIKNSAYDTVLATANRTNGGDYVTQRDSINSVTDSLKNAGASDSDAAAFTSSLKDRYKTFYRTEKLQTWDSGLGAKPPYGDFDYQYYKNSNPRAAQDWANAVNNDDIDITERYGEANFYLQDYTTRGKPAGVRGNAAESIRAATNYLEAKPTDADLQAVRDLQLSVNTETQSQRLLNIPEIKTQWELAKNGDPYWNNLAKEKYLDVSKQDDFAALFRLSERPEDKQIHLAYNTNAGMPSGVTELEDALNQAVGSKAIVDVKKFGALAQNVLKDTITEMKKAKEQEQILTTIRGFSGFTEIMDINKTLADSILGDSGVGEVLSMVGSNDAEESLTKNLQSITGIQSNAVYNWQKWFDEKLKDKYNKDVELGYTADQAEEKIKIDSDFAKNFIDKYLTPRFNTARSMDEFVEYLDVRQAEQNPFQTQDLLNATKLVAQERSNVYLQEIQQTAARSFDPEFYFNPTGDTARATAYADQASTVAKDWEDAKNGNEYWKQQAYRFGVNINDKAAFARMHFEVKGQGKGYDAADDILNASKVKDRIYKDILPALKDEVSKQGTVFGVFITPEEFADETLRGIDPSNVKGLDDVLKQYGMSNFKGTVEEAKQYITEVLRTGSAQDIREQIKYLNEKKEKPTQEILGITYIERPDDVKNITSSTETELYKTFKSAGFNGTEDEFYTKYFPEVDRSEQELLSKAGSKTGFEMINLDLSDPYTSLSTVENFFQNDNTTSTKKTTSSSGSKTDTSDFFRLGSDNEDADYKSKRGASILGEFTSMFKGL